MGRSAGGGQAGLAQELEVGPGKGKKQIPRCARNDNSWGFRGALGRGLGWAEVWVQRVNWPENRLGVGWWRAAARVAMISDRSVRPGRTAKTAEDRPLHAERIRRQWAALGR